MFRFSFVRSLRRAAFSSLLALGLAFAAHAQTETILHDFIPDPYGANPVPQLIHDQAGNLYGITGWGGTYNRGVVFELVRGLNGRWSQKVLYTFSDLYEFDYPSRLLIDASGNLYGTVPYTNSNYCGFVYRLSPSATGEWIYSTIYSFNCNGTTDGEAPMGGLTTDKAGNLYGTTSGGGTYGGGTVFELTPSVGGTWSEQIIFSFGSQTSGGILPQYELVLDSAGDIFGVTTADGDTNCNYYGLTPRGCGTVFDLTETAGVWTENVLYTFTGPNEENSYLGATAGLTMDSAGNLYGPASYSLYELQRGSQGSWTYVSLPQPNGWVTGELIADKLGNFYGDAFNGGIGNGSVFELQTSSSGWTVNTIYTFPSPTVGLDPFGGLTIEADGHLFGTTYRSYAQVYVGSVFEMIPSAGGTWTEGAIYQFPQTDGFDPIGDLISDNSGNLYGVAAQAGPSTNSAGIVFRLKLLGGGGWQFNVIYEFITQPNGSSPSGPSGGLVFDSNGNLYGVTGGGSGGIYGYGTVYKLSPTSSGYWNETTLYSFGAFYGDANSPHGKLVFDKAGNLYGTTSGGGTSSGTVFELSPQASGPWLETVVHNFTGGRDGDGPYAGMVMDNAGNLYGTTFAGGAIIRECEFTCGTVFELSPSSGGKWKESIIHYFSGPPDGHWPQAGLTLDSLGNVYGTTPAGGSGRYGTVFKLSPNASGGWTETTLYNFNDGANGGEPFADLRFDSAGNLYGTTFAGAKGTCDYFGTIGCGTIFKLTPSSGGDWTLSTVHAFGSNLSDGGNPQSGVYVDSSGDLFTMTIDGPGSATYGTIVEIKP